MGLGGSSALSPPSAQESMVVAAIALKRGEKEAAQKYFDNVQRYYTEEECRYFVRSLKEIGLSLPAQSKPEKRP